MKIPAPLEGLPKEVRLVTEPLSQAKIAEMSGMDEVAYECWMDALDAWLN